MKSPLAILSEATVPLLLVGGAAVQAYGYGRLTKDFDCVVAHEKSGVLGDLLEREGFAEFDRSDVAVRYRQPETGWLIDVLAVDGRTFSKLWEKRRQVKFGEKPLQIAAPLHLIAMKLHAIKNNPARKFGDLVDMIELIRREHHSFTREELGGICERYAISELRDTLLEAFDHAADRSQS
jgi:hypothetical protein